MSKLIIGTGSAVNDGTGDSLRDGAIKINTNFSEIYTALGNNSSLLFSVDFTTPPLDMQVLQYNSATGKFEPNYNGGQGNTGSQGIQGATGNTGVGISTASIVSGNLIITLSNTSTINTGTVVGTAGANGATTFSALTDVAGLTVDKFYLPAITKLTVTASGSSAYLFDQYAGNNPTIYAISGTTIAFDLSALTSPSHPFLIRFSGANYDTGLVHVTTAGVVTTGTSAQGKTSGTLYWKIPAGTFGTYGYLCSNHGGMVGTITVKDISAI